MYNLTLPETAHSSTPPSVFIRAQASDGQFLNWFELPTSPLQKNVTAVPIDFDWIGLYQVKVISLSVFNGILGRFRVEQTTFHVTTGEETGA